MADISPIVCTADVENGSDVVTVHGAVLSPINCVQAASVLLAGLGYSVSERISTTQLRISRDYEGSDADGISCEIAQWNQEQLSRVSISSTLRDYNARLALVTRYGISLFYQSIGYTAEGDPGPGFCARNTPAWEDASMLMFDLIDAGGHDETPRLMDLQIGSILTFRTIETGAYCSFKLTEIPSLEDGWIKIDNVIFRGIDASTGGPSDNVDLSIEMLRVGEGLFYDKHSPNVAGLSAYTATAGIKVLVSDTGSGKAGIYTRNDAASAWIGPAILEGPPGPAGATVGEVLAELGVSHITVSTDDPTGGVDGDLWFKVEEV